jgi:DNA-binding response OmpR family regulator
MPAAFSYIMTGRVLIADDDLDMLNALAAVVRHGGRVAVKARDGGELMEALAEAPYDLVITDVAMPWMTGLQAGNSARYAGDGTPILVVTAIDDPAMSDRVAALGQRARLLRKPLELDALERTIEELIAS